MRTRIVVLLLVVGVVAGCGTQSAPSPVTVAPVVVTPAAVKEVAAGDAQASAADDCNREASLRPTPLPPPGAMPPFTTMSAIQERGRLIVGADEFVAFVRKMLNKQPTVHQVHAPEIELTSPTTARGVWALNDVVRLAPGLNLDGFGHYHETYEKADGQWRITSSTLTRLRTDVFNPLISVRISDRMTRAAGKLARR